MKGEEFMAEISLGLGCYETRFHAKATPFVVRLIDQLPAGVDRGKLVHLLIKPDSSPKYYDTH
jgi:hypothetical protein